jgi:hypothetical protein
MSVISVFDLQYDFPDKSPAAGHNLEGPQIITKASGMLVSCEDRTHFRVRDSRLI